MIIFMFEEVIHGKLSILKVQKPIYIYFDICNIALILA